MNVIKWNQGDFIINPSIYIAKLKSVDMRQIGLDPRIAVANTTMFFSSINE